jgi:hypothetical protein
MNETPERTTTLADVIDLDAQPLHDPAFRAQCKNTLDTDGVLVIDNFLAAEVIAAIKADGEENAHLAYYTADNHNIYLEPADPAFADDHPRNREVASSKGCITTDQVPTGSLLHTLYDAPAFRDFLCFVLGETALHEYADPLSSINLHYAAAGQELGWHFDNSSFAITLLVQKPHGGGAFEYVKDVRDADAGEMNYALAGKVLDGEVANTTLTMNPGALVLFRGRNSMHRVTPSEGPLTRMLVVLAYNAQPGVALSESARMTFFGRLD